MDHGGAETRTLEIMRHLDHARFAFDFCVLSGRPGVYAPEIERLGGRVLACAIRPGLATFPVRLLALLRRGRYDVVHSHVHHFSGMILLAARLAGVATRIAHFRNAHDGHPASPRRLAYRACMRRLIAATATRVIGVSEGTMDASWPAWRADTRAQVIYNGIDATRFRGTTGAESVRAEFAIPARARLLVHVGRFSAAKNHRGLVAIAAALVARRRDVVFLLIGDGPLRVCVEDDVAARGLGACFRFAGARDDVARVLGAADAFVFPSLWEGLPGAVLEALAAGLPVIASPLTGVCEIAGTAPGVVLADPADPLVFARAIETVLETPPGGAARVRPSLPSVFTVETSMERLLACYG